MAVRKTTFSIISPGCESMYRNKDSGDDFQNVQGDDNTQRTTSEEGVTGFKLPLTYDEFSIYDADGFCVCRSKILVEWQRKHCGHPNFASWETVAKAICDAVNASKEADDE